MLLFTLSRSELDKCCPALYNEHMEALPPTPYWRTGKVLPVFMPAPLLHRAGRVNPNTLSGFALAPTHGGAGRATRPQKQRPLSGMQRHRRSTTHAQTRQDGHAAGLFALTPARGSLQHAAGSCSGAKEQPISALDKSTERAV